MYSRPFFYPGNQVEEKIMALFFFFYLFAYGVKDLSHLLVLIIFETINVLMAVDASCPLLLLQFLSGSSQESMLWRILRLYFDLCNMFLGSYLC